jgi:phage terminase small subunit
MAKLTKKQQCFIDEYLIDLNATRAAIKAGYSKKTAQQTGSENLLKPVIKNAVEKALAERSERTQIDADWLLNRLAEEATADIADIYDEVTGALKPVHRWPKIWRTGLIAGVDVRQEFYGYGDDREHVGDTTKLKISDRIKRLELIGKHIGVNAFQERTVVGVDDALAALLKEVSGGSVGLPNPSDD